MTAEAAFDALDIRHLSCSSLNRWQGCRGSWVAAYLYGLWGDEGPGLWRGKAVELGLDAFLKGNDRDYSLAAAVREFENGAQGECDDGPVDKERASVEPMLDQCIEAWTDLPTPRASQIKTELWLDGIDIPVIGYLDFAVERDGEKFSIDLKTTHRCPSSLSFNHGMQIASYAKARGEKRAGILYATTKKSAYYEIGEDEIARYISELTRRAHGLQSTLEAAYSRALLEGKNAKETLARMCPPDPDSFYWSEGSLATALENVTPWR